MTDIMDTFKTTMDILSGLLVPFIGIITVWIAFQQFKTNRQAELRQVRTAQMAVYKEVKRLLNHIDVNHEIPDVLYEGFLSAIAEADFLFEESICDWLGEVQSETDQLISWESAVMNLKMEHHVTTKPDEILRTKAPKEYKMLEQEIARSIDTLQNFHCELRERFRPYVSRKGA